MVLTKLKMKRNYLWSNSNENICKSNCVLALESWHLVFSASDVNGSYNTVLDIFVRVQSLVVQYRNTSPKDMTKLGLQTA